MTEVEQDARPLASSPIDPKRRIETIDMVRGFALFGVLLVNMFNFGSGGFFWTEPIDELAWSVPVPVVKPRNTTSLEPLP